MTDNSMTGTFRNNLPQDLLLEAKRAPEAAPNHKLRVDGWQNSWLSRLAELLIGKS
jgi:hypothetical protein